jgi:hypothetical protein
MVKNVVTPARTSVRKVVPCFLNLKNFSMFLSLLFSCHLTVTNKKSREETDLQVICV